MPAPYFSIIVVTLNAAENIEKTLKSILCQTFSDFEIVIKDGVSTDGTLEKIPDDKRIKVFSQRDTGIYNAMNQAIGYSSGKYINFMNCGDTFHDDKVLYTVKERIINQREPDIVYGNFYCEGLYKLQSENLSKFTVYRCSRLVHQSMFFNKNIFNDNVRYDEDFKIFADYDLFTRMFVSKAKISHINYPVCDYLGGGFSETEQNISKGKAEVDIIRKKYFKKSELSAFYIINSLTFPKLRCKLNKSNNVFLKKMYCKIINFLKNK